MLSFPLLPEAFLLCATLFMLVVSVTIKPSVGTLAWLLSIAVGGTIGCIWLGYDIGGNDALLAPDYVSDALGAGFLAQTIFSHGLQTAILLASLVAAYFALPWLSEAHHLAVTSDNKFDRPNTGEYFALILLSALGMSIMVSATDMLGLYIGLELQSLPLYVLAAFRRDRGIGAEAAMKYFVLGALASGVLLYGISLLYGSAGSLAFTDIAAIENLSAISVIGMIFVLATVAFKISAVPFHMWTPDVYQGAPTPVTAFFAAAPKLAAFGLLIRLLTGPFAGSAAYWVEILQWVAIASMLVGALAAIQQQNLKRLLAYSSIGHMGYALIGIIAGDTSSVVFYLMVYVITSLGAFACILGLRQQGRELENVDDLKGLAQRSPVYAYALGAIMISMAGIPIFAGFLAKFYVFKSAVDAELYMLAIVGVVSSVIACYYYLNVCKVMFFDDVETPEEGGAVLALDGLPATFGGRFINTSVVVSAVFVTVFMIFPAAFFWDLAGKLTAGLPF